MSERVLGHGATCCGECDMCTPMPTPIVVPTFEDEEDDE